jgi:SAM-dependent methyltransferase
MSGSGAVDRSAAGRWAAELAGWAIPDEILAAAPESPWGCPPQFFRAAPRAGARSLATTRAAEALPDGGTVLDVGCGGGAASFALVPPAGRVIGVDESPSMLELFRATAADRGVDADTVEGAWPAVADRAVGADVVVCHHVFYNVAELAPFALALGDHAHRRVVAELTTSHPLRRLGPLWQRFWGLDRPDGPTAELALAVLVEAGIDARLEVAPGTPRDVRAVDRAEVVAFTRRRLCLGPDRDPEIDAALGDELFESSDRAVIWWDRAG